MKLTMIGTGYVGLITGVCFSEMGNTVTCADIDEKKIAQLQNKKPTIYESGLEEMMVENIDDGRLHFSSDIGASVQASDIIFLCVGTPQNHDGSAKLDYIFSAAETIAKHLTAYKIVVVKSTVPVGTCRKVKQIIEENRPDASIAFDVVSNPEFLKEGSAIHDFRVPERIVVGLDDTPRKDDVQEKMQFLYAGLARPNRPLMFMKIESSELTKYASNAMLATRISFMNELSCLCEEVGANIKDIANGMGLDSRIGPRFLQAGIGYGGSCFPKDVRALANSMKHNGCGASIIDSVDAVNEAQKKTIFPKIVKALGDVKGKRIALWGLAFKPKTDDVREAPSIILSKQLLEAGASVVGHDPIAQENFSREVSGVTCVEDHYDALDGADLLVLVTEWDEYRNPQFDEVKKRLTNPIIIDGRNIYDPSYVRKLGFTYYGVGR